MLLMLLSGCNTVISDCPEPSAISKEDQAKAAEEMKDLPPGSALGIVLAASLNDRDKLRACRKIH